MPNRISVDMNREGLMRHLEGQPSARNALLDVLDLRIDDVRDVTDFDIDEAADSLERMLENRAHVTARILDSGHPALSDIPAMHISAAMARRLISLGVNPVGLAALGALDLGHVTVVDGPLAGMVIECGAMRREDGRTIVAPSLTTEDLVWDGHDRDLTLLDQVLSETACASAAGRRMDEVLSSAMTDGMGLAVAWMEVRTDSPSTTVHLGCDEDLVLGTLRATPERLAA